MTEGIDGMKSAHTRAITGDQNGTICIATTCSIVMIDSDGNLRMMEDEAISRGYAGIIALINSAVTFSLSYG